VRDPLPVIVVVCDDAKTAVAYFELLKRSVKKKLTLTVVRNPCDRATAADVIAEAKRHQEQLQQPQSHDSSDQSSVWALIDLEQAPERRQLAKEAKEAGEKAGILVATSDPCYEVWTLLHILDTGEAFADCSAVVRRVEREWDRTFGQIFGSKAQADYTKIVPMMGAAAARARCHHEAMDPSWTEVYRLIEEVVRRGT